MKNYAIVMAGGSGKRLWPLSRRDHPKQYLDVIGHGCLVEQTITRVEGLIPNENCVIVSSKAQKGSLGACLSDKIAAHNILFEPLGRNTSPCVALACVHILTQCKGEDAVACVLPSDHYVYDVQAFGGLMGKAVAYAGESDRIVTLGIKPTYPATEYGYIQAAQPVKGWEEILKAQRFIEKPDAQTAEKYLAAGRYYWNSGMFVARVSVFMDHFKRLMPQLYKDIFSVYEAMMKDPFSVFELYQRLDDISIDYGIMEKSDRIVVLPCECGWSDLGSFASFHNAAKRDRADNVVLKGKAVFSEAEGNLVYSNKKLAVIDGLKDYVVIETDNVLYIRPIRTVHPQSILGALSPEEREQVE